MYHLRQFVEAGGLIFYGADYVEAFQQGAVLVDKILKGAKPADLPVEQPWRFALAINLKTGKALAEYEAAYFGVNATVRDYARFGMLLANDGALDGRQIIPAGWVRAATTPPAKQSQPGQTNSFLGYGYQIWIVPGKERQFMLRGLRGQGVFVDPKSKLVMVHTAAGDVGDPGMGERIALWFAVVDRLAQ